MKIGLVQYSPVWEDKLKNQDRLINLIFNKKRNEDVLIFPEMSLTGFTMNAASFAESLDGESFRFFAGLALNNKAHVLSGIIEERDGKYYNSLMHINPLGKIEKVYRKIHPFSLSSEDKHYARGVETVVTKIGNWNAGLSICYDLRFPELYRQYGKSRVELIVVIASWPAARIEHWKTLLKARAIENQCYVAGVNRAGNDIKLKYNGCSCIYDPMGSEVISSEDNETILSADISIDKVKELQLKLPFLDDIVLI
ncbi:MAG: nitrilase-related carbon-nitrogen hydrolase [Ignavibacteriaceae bacterium]|nr:nitrilase-related carbon-nitrogen hydrolase [Ignavibacteriaceae bacterium]